MEQTFVKLSDQASFIGKTADLDARVLTHMHFLSKKGRIVS